MKRIPYGKQLIADDDIAEVVRVLKSDFLTQGPMVEKFEQALQERFKAKYAIAVCNATAALHLAYRALGVGKNDLVWTSPNTFLATSNAALFCEARVDFVDICLEQFNISVEHLRNKLVLAKKLGDLPKVVVPVHFGGHPCDMKQIFDLSKEFGFKVLEDASHAVGATYNREPVGSCQYSDVCVFSFHPVKIITTGEGGSILTNNQAIADRVRLLRSHGMTRNSQDFRSDCFIGRESEEENAKWYYQQQDLGYNYRMTDLQAGLGVSQLKKLDHFIMRRREIAEKYQKQLSNFKIQLPVEREESKSSYHLFPIRVNESEIRQSRLEIFNHIKDHGIDVNVLYIPVYTQPYYAELGFKKGYCPNSEKYYKDSFVLPIFPGLTTVEYQMVIDVLTKVLRV